MPFTPVVTTPPGDAAILRLQAFAEAAHREFSGQVTRRETDIARHKSVFHQRFLAHARIERKTGKPPIPSQLSLKERFNTIMPAPLAPLKAPVRKFRPAAPVNTAIPETAPVIEIPPSPTDRLVSVIPEEEIPVKYEDKSRGFSFRRLFDRSPKFGTDR